MLRDRGADVFAAVVRRSDDARLERLLGARGLRVLFAEMTRRFVPAEAAGFTGAIVYELIDAAGVERPWTVTVDGERARARPGDVLEPAVRLRASVADFARIATGELDAGDALLDGRLDVWGDVAVAARLGEMFGRPGLLR